MQESEGREMNKQAEAAIAEILSRGSHIIACDGTGEDFAEIVRRHFAGPDQLEVLLSKLDGFVVSARELASEAMPLNEDAAKAISAAASDIEELIEETRSAK